MSAFKYFAPPEWDVDVPEESHHQNLIKKLKLKSKSKSGKEEPNNISVHSNLNDNNKIGINEENFSVKNLNNDKQFKKEKPKLFKEKDVAINHLPVQKIFNKSNKRDDNKKDKNAESSLKSKSINKKIKSSLDENVESNLKNGLKKRKSSIDENNKNVESSLKNHSKNKKRKRSKDEHTDQINKIPKNEHSDANVTETPNNKNEIAPKKKKNKKKDKEVNKKDINNEADNSTNLHISHENNGGTPNNKQPTQKNAKKKLKKIRKEQNLVQQNNIEVVQQSNIKLVQQNNNSSVTPEKLSKTEKNRKRRRKKSKQKSLNSISITEKSVSDKNNKIVVKLSDKNIKITPEKTLNNVISKREKTSFLNKVCDMLKNESIENQPDTNDGTLVENGSLERKIKPPRDLKAKSLRERMMERLKGARFRYLNEQMYSKESKVTKTLFGEDPTAFKAYHDGYRQQVNKWPLNPLDTIIKDVSTLPENYTIADLGCGDGRLSKSVPHKVHSFDLVSLDPLVQACDMSHLPLLSSQVNVVVFCLSLMGTNLMDYVIEANRILKTGGLLKIAEVESRFDNVDDFLQGVQKYGFSLIKSDLTNNLFYFMDFKKESDIKKRNKLPELTLKPCLYKKR